MTSDLELSYWTQMMKYKCIRCLPTHLRNFNIYLFLQQSSSNIDITESNRRDVDPSLAATERLARG